MNIERFVDELFSLISDERNRRILSRCADGPKTLKVLNEGVGNTTASPTTGKRQRTVEKDMNRMRVLGLLDGTPDTGWTLVASEVRGLIVAVRRADANPNIFNALANQTVRAVLAAMLGPEKTRTELRVCGDTADISNAIRRLTDLGVIEKINDNPKTWRRNAHAEPWMEVLARANLLVHALLDGSARRAARQGAHALSEPGVVSEDHHGGRASPQTAMDRRTLTRIFGDSADDSQDEALRHLRANYTSPIEFWAPARRALRPEMLDGAVLGTFYADDPHAITLVLTALFELHPADARFVNSMRSRLAAWEQGGWKASGSPTVAQIRGRRRKRLLRAIESGGGVEMGGGEIRIGDLDLPSVEISTTPEVEGCVAMQHAAKFLPETNTLMINGHWSNLASTALQLPDDLLMTPESRRITSYIDNRLRLRLVEHVLLHEHYVADLPDGISPAVTDDALTFAAHWSVVEIRDIKRVVNGFLTQSVDMYGLDIA